MSGLRTKLYRLKERVKKKREQKRFGKCAVLLYHRVADLQTDPQLLAVSPQNFDEQLKCLRLDHDVLSVSEFESLIGSEKRFPKRAVLLTFDDGYADNYQYAMPLLEKHKMQALFYISTCNIDTDREFWWDEVERLVLLPGSFPNEFDLTVAGVRFESSKQQLLQSKEVYNRLLPHLRNMNVDQREINLEVIRNISSNKTLRPSHRAMSLEELRKFSSSSSVVIGAHTKNHPSLAALSADEQFQEINESKSFLERNLDRKIEHFSYPFGTHADFNKNTEQICRQLQFKYVAANFPGIVTAKSSPISFPRFIVRNWAPERFQAELNNFFRQ